MAPYFSSNILRRLRSNSLSRSLMLGITATVCTMVITLSCFHYVQLYMHGVGNAERRTVQRIETLTDILSIPVWNIEQDTVERIISVFAESSTVLRIRVEEPNGKLFADKISDTSVPADKVISRDIFHNNQHIGRIITHITFAPIKQEHGFNLLYHASMIVLLLIAILFLTRHLLKNFLMKPLDQLSIMIDQIRKGDYHAPHEQPETQELRDIAANFEEMAKRVAIREEKLKAINEQLQQTIIEREAVEEELRRSQEQFTLVAASTMDGIVEHKLNDDHLQYTPRWKQLTGFTDEELTTSVTKWIERVHPDDRNTIRKMVAGIGYDRSGRAELEYRAMHKNGQYRWYLGKAQVVYDEQGTIARLIGAHSDITAKKNAEQRLIATKEMLQNVINCMPSLIVGVTEHMTISLWNDTAEDTTGVLACKAEGQKFKDLFPELAFIERQIQQSLYAEKAITIPKVTSITKGTPITYDIVIFPVAFGSKRTAVLRIDDVTENLRMEEMIIQTEKMASISGLAAGMAHEINNPLGGILQGVQNVQRRFSPQLAGNIKVAESLGFSLEQVNNYMHDREIHSLLDGITDCGKRAASIIANMLEFSRSSDTKRVPVDIHDLIEKSIELASNDYHLRNTQQFNDITILRDYDRKNVTQLSCAPQEIEQVLLNLLKNAAQAMKEVPSLNHKPVIEIATQQTPTGVMVTLSDNGPGMKEEVRKRVFEPFYTTKPVGEGTGLGLSVSYYIITNNHSGIISVTSAINQGATFIIQLPHAM